MTIAHLSDTHLGFRAYARVNSGGINQREADVMDTFKRTLNAIVKKDPDLVIHSGDVFHQVRPSNQTIIDAYLVIEKFQKQRDGRPFLMIGGNHETPRTLDAGSILRLFDRIPGMKVVPIDAERGIFHSLECEYLAIPTRALELKQEIDYRPTYGAKYSILGIHAMMTEAMFDHGELSVSQISPEKWTYVGLGDYHIRKSFASNCCYPGSTDYTSTNIWEEISTPKSWVWFDTDRGKIEYQPTKPRETIDLPRINAEKYDGQELTDALLKAASWSAVMPIVRQVVENVSLDTRCQLDRRRLREIDSQCLRYGLELQTSMHSRDHSNGTAMSMEQEWNAFVDSREPNHLLDPGLLKELGQTLLKECRDEIDSIEA